MPLSLSGTWLHPNQITSFVVLLTDMAICDGSPLLHCLMFPKNSLPCFDFLIIHLFHNVLKEGHQENLKCQIQGVHSDPTVTTFLRKLPLWLLNPCHLGPLFLFLQPPFNVGIIASWHETASLPPEQFRPSFHPTRNGYPNFSLELKLCDSAVAAPQHHSHQCQDTFPTGSNLHQHCAEGKASK